jgi:hypothetical protein
VVCGVERHAAFKSVGSMLRGFEWVWHMCGKGRSRPIKPKVAAAKAWLKLPPEAQYSLEVRSEALGARDVPEKVPRNPVCNAGFNKIAAGCL